MSQERERGVESNFFIPNYARMHPGGRASQAGRGRGNKGGPV